ncbi:MAG: DMT family transporter [Cyanobacteria bacterium P01_F01_bin.150]
MEQKILKVSKQMQSQVPLKSLLIGYLLAIVTTLIWAGNFIIARALHESILPVGLAFWRWTIATVSLGPFAIWTTIKDWKSLQINLPYLSISALLGVTVFNTLIYMAGHTSQAINLALIAAASPIFVVIMSRLFYNEAFSVKQTRGILIVLVGVVLLITEGSLGNLLSASFAIGDLYMLAAALIFAIYTMLVKRKPRAIRMITFTFSTFCLGLLFLAPFYALECLIYHPVNFNASIILALIYVGVLSSVVAFLAWNKAIDLIGPSRTALTYYLIPIFSGIFAWIFLGEAIVPVHIFSMFLIVIGIITTNQTGEKFVKL